jgi:hypothetical protein
MSLLNRSPGVGLYGGSPYIVADRADLLGLLLDLALLLRLASQPTLNAGLSLKRQVEYGR